MSAAAVRCFYCDAEATLLCDGVLGWRREWYQREEHAPRFDGAPSGWWAIRTGRFIIDRREEPTVYSFALRDPDSMVTCDRPLCDGCATRAGVTFFCGEDGGVETTDHCRECALTSATKPPLLDDETLNALQRRRALRTSPTRKASVHGGGTE